MNGILEKTVTATLLDIESSILDELIRFSTQPHGKRTPLEISSSDAPGIVGKDGRIHDAIMEILPSAAAKVKVIRVLRNLETKEVLALNLACLLGQSVKRVYGYEKITPLLDESGEIGAEYFFYVMAWLNNKVMEGA